MKLNSPSSFVMLSLVLSFGCLARSSRVSDLANQDTTGRSQIGPSAPCSTLRIDPSSESLDTVSEQETLVQFRCVRRENLALLGAIDDRGPSYWEDGVVNYRFDPGLSKTFKKNFRFAANVWENGVNSALEIWGVQGRLKFIEDVSQQAADYILIIDNQEVSASVTGKTGGEQLLRLKDESKSKRTMLHEMGHALGLSHEQSRCDRDKYIKIVKENILETKLDNFKKRCRNNVDLLEYNIGSIMHYSFDAFSKNGQPTMILKSKPDLRWEQPSEPSASDFLTVAIGFAKYAFEDESKIPKEYLP